MSMEMTGEGVGGHGVSALVQCLFGAEVEHTSAYSSVVRYCAPRSVADRGVLGEGEATRYYTSDVADRLTGRGGRGEERGCCLG